MRNSAHSTSERRWPLSSNARICRAPLEAVEKLCLKIPGLKAGDQLIFGFAIYRVGNLIDLKNVGRNHVNFDVTVTLGSMDSISDRLLDVLEATPMKYKEEIAISNRVLVVGRENSMVREFNMAFIDYKSNSYDAVSAAKNRNKRFQESGSSALARLAEAKGAVELLLAQAYVRRAKVALIAFRGTTAELLLPPTRSLARAKRCLGDLAGGGGTPIAAGLSAALDLAMAAKGEGTDALSRRADRWSRECRR